MKHRTDRLNKELKNLTNAIFAGEISDQRISGIQITQAKISKDLGVLKLYFAGQNNNISIKETLELLYKTSGFIKKQIAGACIMRTIPQIIFEFDKTDQRLEKIDDIFRQIAQEKRNNNYYEDDSDNFDYDDETNKYDDEDLEDYDDDYDDELDDELGLYDDLQDDDVDINEED